jgi:hypothetical protein
MPTNRQHQFSFSFSLQPKQADEICVSRSNHIVIKHQQLISRVIISFSPLKSGYRRQIRIQRSDSIAIRIVRTRIRTSRQLSGQRQCQCQLKTGRITSKPISSRTTCWNLKSFT